MKSRKSRDTWNNRKFRFGIQNEAGKRLTVLPREYNGHSKHPLLTAQKTSLHTDINRWSILKSDRLYFLQLKMETFYTVSKTRPGADCGSGHELLVPKFRRKLKKVG